MLTRPARCAAVLLVLALASGCGGLLPALGLSRGLSQSRTVQLGGTTFVLEWEPPDERVAGEVAAALEAALPRLTRWGGFTAPILVRIHPTHASLEQAVRRYDYPWLRAWARFDTVDLQSPRTWSLLGASVADVTELLTHELTHCLMYQRAGTANDWMFKGIPLWFREGMASVTASQGYRRLSDEELWRYLRRHPEKDPIADAESLYQAEADFVYGAAHRAFEFLVHRYGDEAVRAILDAMRAGSRFDAAFDAVVGLPERAFSREYVRFVKWEGWRRRPSMLPPVLVPRPGSDPGSAGDR